MKILIRPLYDIPLDHPLIDLLPAPRDPPRELE